MVEGPGCTLNGEKIRSKVQKGQKLKEIRGSLTTSSKNNPGGHVFHSFYGCLYTGVETLGKELFMYFGPRALRVHFGMNGSMRINPAERKDRMGTIPVLEIHLTNDIVCFFDSTVEMRLTEDCEQRMRAMESLDVCSPKFSFSHSEEAVRSQSSRMLCDVLLDQAVMPGVGNIIKNEVLFDSGLHPAVKVQQLTDEQIHHMVKMTRDFTLLFYKCRKSGSPLYKHYKVYKRSQCGQCFHVITVCRLGDNGRMTYFCERCQKGDPSRVDISKLPVRNRLTNWVYNDRTNDNVAKKEEEDWACQLCTLINQPAAKACDACLTPRPEVHKDDISTEASPFTTDLIKYPCTAFKKPQEELKVNWRSAFGTSTLVFSDLSKKPKPVNSPLSPAGSHLNSLAAEQGLYKYSVCQGTTSPNYASGGWQKQSAELSNGESLASYSHPSKKMRIDHSPFPSNNAQNGTPNTGTHRMGATSRGSSISSSPSAPCCSSHSRPAVLRVVHKEGENKGRQFYACSLPRETKCNFFEWADLHFPSCHHGKRCLMRTVLKLGPNNGRNFYTCSFQKGKQCDFFQWAQNGPGVSILPGC
ncbi:endonuclease 8-like 3 [Seriola lalandi dorsalis]|uniref:Endonuclease 8-like 3 n=1 Tax=Seriola lalandi dorsalis TaxID=1841481 RepID=A0A3B4YQS4_SERLL|nr:endonuclease 8-like 3 [Seriola lalandi dorsalis]XP_056239521.1 endonuclease 8-like 3 [Seriola aureovittata]